jgi:hypothetical protein
MYAQRRNHSGDRTFLGNVILLHGIPARAIRDEQAAAIAALLAWAATAAEAGDDAKDG